ncbi:MAG: hypothetical protein HYV53_01620 [Parcubacteria group bacterium]|nr:hypothetical protein [Parcubacteria group bacterium]
MQNLFKTIKHKINGAIIHFVASGLILVIAAVLIVWTDFFLRLVIGLLIIIVAYIFFYLAYKTWWLKREIEKHLKL